MKRGILFIFLLAFGSIFLLQPQPGLTGNYSPVAKEPVSGREGVLVFREVQTVIDRDGDDYFKEFLHTPLAIFLPGTDKIAGVKETRPLTEARFPRVGSVRQVCLKDGSTAAEKVTDLQERYLKYRVSDYSLEQAKPIEYGIGEFWFIPIEKNRVLIRWKYTFKLKDNVFPGNLGCLGRTLFKWTFLDRDYAEFMNVGINAIKNHGERKSKLL